MSSNQQPLVSVIIASYNHAHYIEASILSVLAQSYSSVELLVVDDGSSDDSVARIEALQRVHGFDFRVQANQGLSRTLNEVIARAKGSLIAPFGSDDIMLPERLALQVAHLADRPEVGICAGAIRSIDAAGLPLGGGAICRRGGWISRMYFCIENPALRHRPCCSGAKRLSG